MLHEQKASGHTLPTAKAPLCCLHPQVQRRRPRNGNSLEAQRESCEAYVASQRAEGWLLVSDRYDDGGFSGGTLDRPALKRLLTDVEAGKVDVVVVYKIDRLSRSLMDFSRLVEVFELHLPSASRFSWPVRYCLLLLIRRHGRKSARSSSA